ncbi:MAG: hypothetical protein HY064_12205 [Bacteroidetes bacterium]|nr:hypothetical protein [Bacteroidota bacterium]
MKTTIISFELFKSDFYRRFPDLKIFDCGSVNLVKVVLEGLKVNYSAKGKIRNSFDEPELINDLRSTFQRIRSNADQKKIAEAELKKLHQLVERPFLFIDHSPRVHKEKDGSIRSFYYYKLQDTIGRDRIAMLKENQAPEKSDFDLSVIRFAGYLQLCAPGEHEKKFRKELRTFFQNTKHLFNVEEQKNVGFALEKFYDEYRVWKYILEILPQKKIVLLCHYHHEGAIHAMHEAGRTVIEAQHGLISKEDVFYCMPENIKTVRERALFPDHILVYGEYWKQILSSGYEFLSAAIHVAGYFHAEDETNSSAVSISGMDPEKKIILVTTQTFLHEHFIRYIEWLSADCAKRFGDHVILVKLHPNEKRELYSALNDLKNVVFTDLPVVKLFPLAVAHISIYSTTLYEALRCNSQNFALDVAPELKGYVNGIVDGGVACRLLANENPLEKLTKDYLHGDSRNFFGIFDPGIIQNIFQ